MDRESVFIHHCFWGFNFQVVNICACAKDHSSDPNSNISLVSTIELWVYLRRGTVYIMWWRSPTHTVTVHEQATALPLLQSRLHQVIVSGVTGVLMHPVMVFYYQDWTVIVLKLEMVLQKQDEWFMQVAISQNIHTSTKAIFYLNNSPFRNWTNYQSLEQLKNDGSLRWHPFMKQMCICYRDVIQRNEDRESLMVAVSLGWQRK